VAFIFLLLPSLLSSLATIGDELACPRGRVEALVYDFVSCAEAPLLARIGVVLAFWSLAIDREVLACHYEEAKVLVFDLVVVAKALAQFKHSSEVLVFNLDTSLEATVQFEQATEVKEAFLGRCLRLRLEGSVVVFGHARAVALPSNMVDAELYRSMSSDAGGCYEFSCDTLPQPLILTACWQTVIVQRLLEAVQHHVVDAYNLSVAIVGLRKLL